MKGRSARELDSAIHHFQEVLPHRAFEFVVTHDRLSRDTLELQGIHDGTIDELLAKQRVAVTGIIRQELRVLMAAHGKPDDLSRLPDLFDQFLRDGDNPLIPYVRSVVSGSLKVHRPPEALEAEDVR